MQKPTVTQLTADLQSVERMNRRDEAIVSARPLLIKAFFVVWAVVDIALVGFFVLQVVVYIVSGSFVELREAATLGRNIAATHAISESKAAEELLVGSPRVLQNSSTAYDFYVVIENPNADWYATFEYAFTYGDQTTDALDGFVMPGEEKYLLTLNEKPDSRPASSDIILTNLQWHRVDRHDVPESDAWLAEHQDFDVASATYATDVELAEENIGRSVFTVKNATPYAYWEPKFTVILERNGSVVGVHQASISRFVSGETREVAVHWSGEVPSSATATLLSNINYFDTEAYMSPSGGQGIDARDLFTGE